MTFRDSLGRPLQEGDNVAFGMGLGNSAIATIVKTEHGIGQLGENPHPTVVIQTFITLPAQPNGFVPGVVKLESLPKPEEQSLKLVE